MVFNFWKILATTVFEPGFNFPLLEVYSKHVDLILSKIYFPLQSTLLCTMLTPWHEMLSQNDERFLAMTTVYLGSEIVVLQPDKIIVFSHNFQRCQQISQLGLERHFLWVAAERYILGTAWKLTQYSVRLFWCSSNFVWLLSALSLRWKSLFSQRRWETFAYCGAATYSNWWGWLEPTVGLFCIHLL